MFRPFLLLILTAGCAVGADASPAFLRQHCVACHGADVQKGDLRLDDLGDDFTKHAKVWAGVRERLAAGTMPPAKRPQPTAAEKAAVLAWIDTQAAAAEAVRHKREGRVPLRRLNRTEYENTVRDLLGVSVELKSLLPADTLSHGFDNQADALSVSAVQMQRYLETAEKALKASLAAGPKPESTKRTFNIGEGRAASFLGTSWLKRPDGAIVNFSAATYPNPMLETLRITTRGTYTLRISGYGFQSKDAVPFALYHGHPYRGGDLKLQGYHEFPPDTPTTVSVSVTLEVGDTVQVIPFGLKGAAAFLKKNEGKLAEFPGPGLALSGVEVEGPLFDVWPPKGHALLFGELPVKQVSYGKGPPQRNAPWEVQSANPDSDFKAGLTRLTRAAFRRAVADADIEPYLKLAMAEYKGGASFQEAMLAAASAVLCSPRFLYFQETPGTLDDHALAARLSYMLTRSAPDAELLTLAATNTLHRPPTLRAQTERLLKSSAADRFTADFTDAWLNLREIDFTTPDKALYPEFDDLLQHSMVCETRSFFRHVLDANRPATDFLASDYAMLNHRLARHYRLDPVAGVALRKVPLPAGSVRGGLLSQAAVLKVSANGTNTSPVVRGVYVLERFLGTTPPPPPPGVPAVEPDIRGAKTVRELLDKHRATETCAGCHKLIDPPGFALENFDVIGGWRDKFRALPSKPGVAMKVDGDYVRYVHGQPVDAAGEFTDGRRFQGYDEFRTLLLSQPETFAACLAGKLVAFGTGREPGAADRVAIRGIAAQSAKDKYAFRELVHTVVQSEIFRTK